LNGLKSGFSKARSESHALMSGIFPEYPAPGAISAEDNKFDGEENEE
jgi:hypothetical protein